MMGSDASTGSRRLDELLSKLGQYRRAGRGFTARCPAHDDRHASLSVALGKDGRILLKCHAGCDFKQVAVALDVPVSAFFAENDNGREQTRRVDNAKPRDEDHTGLTLAAFAEHKKIPAAALTFYGVTEVTKHGRPCLEFEYRHRDGSRGRTQVRTALTGERFFWKSDGGDVIAYEPDGGALARSQRELTIVEGTSDTLTLLYAGFAAVGAPSATYAHVLQAHHLENVERVFVVHERDSGGATFVAGVKRRVRELGVRVRLIELQMPAGCKDPSDLFQHDPAHFAQRYRGLLEEASRPPRPAHLTLGDFFAQEVKPRGMLIGTGFPSLDDAHRGGLDRKRLVFVAGAPFAFKTGLLAYWAHRWESEGVTVVIYATDESGAAIAMRLGQLMGFSREALEDEGEIGAAVRAECARRMADRRITLLDPRVTQKATTLEHAEKVLEYVAPAGPRALIVDSLHTIMTAASAGSDGERDRIIANIAVCRAIADRGCLVVATAEMNRGAYAARDQRDRTNPMAAIRETSRAEYAIDTNVTMYPVEGEDDVIQMLVPKARGGHGTSLRLKFNRARCSFEEIAGASGSEPQVVGAAAKRMERAKERVRAVLRAHRDLPSKRQVIGHCEGTSQHNLMALEDMMEAGEVVVIGGVFRLQVGDS